MTSDARPLTLPGQPSPARSDAQSAGTDRRHLSPGPIEFTYSRLIPFPTLLAFFSCSTEVRDATGTVLTDLLLCHPVSPLITDRLVGLVVKASASRAEGPGFESRLRRDFFGVESYQ